MTNRHPSSAARRGALPPGSKPYVVVGVGCGVAGVVAVFWRPSVALLLWAVPVMFGVYIWGFNRYWQRRRSEFDQQRTTDLERIDRSLASGEIGPSEGRERKAEIEARQSPDDEYASARSTRLRFGSKPILILGWTLCFAGFGLIVAQSPFGPWVLVLGISVSLSSLFVRGSDRQLLKDQMDRARLKKRS